MEEGWRDKDSRGNVSLKILLRWNKIWVPWYNAGIGEMDILGFLISSYFSFPVSSLFLVSFFSSRFAMAC